MKKTVTIPSKFNRLVVMETEKTSWHSVNKVNVEASRKCISNYFFANIHSDGSFRHITSFYGRPENRRDRILLSIDRLWRNAAGKILPNTVLEILQGRKH